MEIPDWLTEARAALIVSLVSALFTGLGLVYARRLAVNDSERMKRKPLIFEIVNHGPDREIVGFDTFLVTVRNLEPVSAEITGVRVIGREQQVLTRETAFDKAANGFDAPIPKADPPSVQSSSLLARVGPVGTPWTQYGIHPAATISIWLYAKGVQKTSDVQMVWRWADGKTD